MVSCKVLVCGTIGKSNVIFGCRPAPLKGLVVANTPAILHQDHTFKTKFCNTSQILRNGQLQGRRDRRFQAQGGHATSGRRHRRLQEGEPHHVRLGDPG